MYLTLGVFFTGILLLPRSPLDRLLYGLPGGDPGAEAGYTLPSGLYMDMGMVMMPKTGVPRGGAMGGNIGSARPSTCDADPEPRVPTSSRTSPAAPRVCHPARLWEARILGTPHLEAAMS